MSHSLKAQYNAPANTGRTVYRKLVCKTQLLCRCLLVDHHHTIKCGLILKLLPKVFWIAVWSEFYPPMMAGAEVCWLNQTMNWQFKSEPRVWGRSWGRGSTCLPSHTTLQTQCPWPPAIMDLCLSDHETYDIYTSALKRDQSYWQTLNLAWFHSQGKAM